MLNPRPLFPRFISLIVLLIVDAFGMPIVSKAQLSQNSGINSADTYVIVDLTMTINATISLPSPYYNPTTQTTSTVLNVAPAARTFHVEAGYDPSGGLVMNVWPTGSPVNPMTTDASAIGFLRFAGGQITVFDQNGKPLPVVLPSTSMPAGWPLNLLGSNPGRSVVGSLVVANIQTYAAAINASLTMSSSPSAAYVRPPAQQNSSATWTYVPSGSNWIAQQLVFTPAISAGSATSTIQFANMSWHDNPTNDAARAAKGYTAALAPASTANNPSALTVTPPGSQSTVVNRLGGPQNVAFMHGFGADSSTWNRMTNWLNQDFRFGNEVIPTFPWSNHLYDQGTSLVNEINSVGGTGYILIGHSQGGLVSRYAAQLYQTGQNQATVKGVVALDTPHQGAPIALTGGPTILASLELLGNYLYGVTGCRSSYDNFVCYMAAVVFYGAPAVGDVWYSTNPDIQDLIPGSGFLNQLNGYPESFSQAGVVSYTPLRWNEMRVLDNALFGRAGCYPETWCGEEVMATATDIAFYGLVARFFFDIFMAEFDPNNYFFWWDDAMWCLDVLIVMDAIDVYWNLIVSGYSSSDAIVPASSQNYPSNSAVQYPISSADSHMGATKSIYVHSMLDQVLAGPQFKVLTQSSCAYSASPANYPISGTGGNGTFALNTGAGCQWSAVSQSGWITITSGSSGTSSGSVAFSVAANPVSIPRTGTITAGNGSSSVTFTVTQAGLCVYSLSEGPALAIPPSGGSYSVSVSAGNGCVWSAVSNSNWLTVSAGASGTGSGSFSFTATPNVGATDLSGTITVMSQTLTVVIGSPVGTPGQGSVTISGGPNSTTVNMCPNSYPYNCPQTIYNTGTITVTVGGDAFAVSYGGGDTPLSLASALAYEMNHLVESPISASAATVPCAYPNQPWLCSTNAVLTITSTINGAATNFPLGTSYTYDTKDFNSPAFWVQTSGASLTGGTD